MMLLQGDQRSIWVSIMILYCMEWTNDAVLSAQVLNRHQDNLDLLFIDGTTGTSK
jgi:hypothetical protein